MIGPLLIAALIAAPTAKPPVSAGSPKIIGKGQE